MKRKIIIIAGILLVLVTQAVWVIPAFAADNSTTATPAAQQVNKAKILVRLLVVQDETKVDAFLAKAVAANKISADNAAKVKDIWVKHHAQFAPGKPLIRILKAQDGAKVDAFLAKAVAAGKLQQAQADQIKALWTQLHTK